MGSALVRGWLQEFRNLHITIIEPSPVRTETNIVHLTAADQLEAGFDPDIVVLAVKPQMMDEACATLKEKLSPAAPLLSIAAGKPLAYFSGVFGTSRPVIRSMPNTPAAIGHGVTVACANLNVSKDTKALATSLLKAVGLVEWIEDEGLMDAVTAVSGSGPAYVFLLIEEMAAAGVKAGLPADLAMTLARQTVIGSARLAEFEETHAASELRQNVTSPNGTTAAALEILMGDEGLKLLMEKAVAAATNRGRELAK